MWHKPRGFSIKIPNWVAFFKGSRMISRQWWKSWLSSTPQIFLFGCVNFGIGNNSRSKNKLFDAFEWEFIAMLASEIRRGWEQCDFLSWQIYWFCLRIIWYQEGLHWEAACPIQKLLSIDAKKIIIWSIHVFASTMPHHLRATLYRPTQAYLHFQKDAMV